MYRVSITEHVRRLFRLGSVQEGTTGSTFIMRNVRNNWLPLF